jgi:hypothetical protein
MRNVFLVATDKTFLQTGYHLQQGLEDLVFSPLSISEKCLDNELVNEE